ncbi:MAG: ATP-grasp domain-containing protein [Verrucomicrobiota bacterium]
MSKNPRLLVAGGSHSDIPLIQAGKALGFFVITSGNRPEDFGHSYADAYYPADYSDPVAICQLAVELEVDAICACCNDFSAIACSYTAEQLGLPGHDALKTTKIIHHKHLWRRFAAENGIPTPTAMGCSSVREAIAALETIASPWMIKPVDLTGGKGISKAHMREEALPAIQKALQASKVGHIVVEEFVEGTRHGFTSIIREKKVVFHFSDDEHYYLNQYLVSGATSPSSSSPEATADLIRISEQIISMLNLTDGIFHVQYIERGGKPCIIEICRRAPGDLYVDLVRLSAGVPYAEWIVRASTGLNLDLVSHSPSNRSITRHCIMGSQKGIYEGLEISPELENRIVEQLVWAKPGDKVDDPSTQKFGIVFVEHASVAQRTTDVPRMNQLIEPRIQSDQG